MKFFGTILMISMVAITANSSDLKVSYSCVNDNHDELNLRKRIQGPEFDLNSKTCQVTFDAVVAGTTDRSYRSRYNFRNRCNSAVKGSFVSIEIPRNLILEESGGYPKHTSIVVNHLQNGEPVATEFQCEKN